jgi:hypothetical protein
MAVQQCLYRQRGNDLTKWRTPIPSPTPSGYLKSFRDDACRPKIKFDAGLLEPQRKLHCGLNREDSPERFVHRMAVAEAAGNGDQDPVRRQERQDPEQNRCHRIECEELIKSRP